MADANECGCTPGISGGPSTCDVEIVKTSAAGAMVGGAIGGLVGGPPGAAVGAGIGAAIGAKIAEESGYCQPRPCRCDPK